MAARAAIRAVGRALDYTYSDQDKTAKMIPGEIGITLKQAIEINPDLKYAYDRTPHIKRLLDSAMSLEGLPLYTGTHAAGVLITGKEGVNAHVPTWKNDTAIVSQFDMNNLEELGLLKMDFLGLKTLTVISNTIKMVKKNYGKDISVDELYKCDDLNAFEIIKKGHTDGIFQLESDGMTDFMVKLQPSNIEEIIAGISLYRPGPMQYIPDYLINKRDQKKITYIFPVLKDILNETYGILCYQEQCMRAVIAIAGYQKHHSDSFRKAIAKKKADLIAEHKEYFIYGRKAKYDEAGHMLKDEIPGGIKMGYKESNLIKFYKEMEDFGKYAFNKCFSGNEKLYRGRNESVSLSIGQMYKIKNDVQYAKDHKHFKLHEKYKRSGYGKALSMCEDGRLRSNKIIDIYYSGKKDVYLLTSEDGSTIRCTLNHSFPTPNGKKLLSDMIIGDEIYTKDSYEEQIYVKTNVIRYKNLPKKGQCGFQKGGPIGTWHFDQYRLAKVGERCELCTCEGKELHHKDGNKDNNTEKNYQWLCVSCHKKEHYKLGRTKQYEKGIPSKISKIKSIELIEKDSDVYDVEMAAPYHNVVVEGGIVASNSHAAAYAVIGYCTAYLKTYFRSEFMAALMDSIQKNKNKVGTYINHCRNDLNINVLKPDINKGEKSFVALPDGSIVYSLHAKGVGEDVLDAICDMKRDIELKTPQQFFEMFYEVIDKKALEAFVSIGALDGLNIVRSKYIAALDDIMTEIRKMKDAKKKAHANEEMELSGEQVIAQGKKPRKRITTFNFKDKFNLDSRLPQINEFPEHLKLKLEKKFLGLYLTGHPLNRYIFGRRNLSFRLSALDYEINEETGSIRLLSKNPPKNGSQVEFFAIINSVNKLVTKQGNKLMATLEIEDETLSCKAIVFPEAYKNYSNEIQEDVTVLIKGSILLKDDEVPMIACDSFEPINYAPKLDITHIIHSEESGEILLGMIKNGSVRGSDAKSPLHIITDVSDSKNKIKMHMPESFNLNPVFVKSEILDSGRISKKDLFIEK